VTAPDLSVIVVTWNGLELTRRALRSLAEHADGLALQVIVVDNGSADDTAVRLPQEFPNARYVRLDRNLGFAAANNRALAVAEAPLLMLLNNDAVVLPGTLRALAAAARSAPEFGVFATQMLQLRHPDRVDNRGIYLDATGHCRQLDSDAPAEPGPGHREVFGASGGACVVRAEVVERIGLFDESLESYQEDCDFACRARAHGVRTLYVPDARVLHEGSATGDRIADRKLYLIQRNMAVVTRRWLPFHPLRPTSWLSAARQAYYVARAVPARRAGLVLRAKRDALRHVRPAPPPPDGLARVRAWVGVRGRPASVPPSALERREVAGR
jgi:N-acetylglucosaminyl-diphospho-decaprenol L-rhamnosyltransferase